MKNFKIQCNKIFDSIGHALMHSSSHRVLLVAMSLIVLSSSAIALFALHATTLAAKEIGDTIGIYNSSNHTFYLRNSLSAGSFNESVAFGQSGDIGIVGDWNGDGVDTVGIYRPSTATFYLKNANTTSAPIAYTIKLGVPDELPVVGDWRNTGHDGIGVYQPSSGTFLLKSSLSNTVVDYKEILGDKGDVPVSGDWNGDGADSPGVYQPSIATYYLTNNVCNCTGYHNYTFVYGSPGDLPVAGDWTATNHSGIGIYHPQTETFLLSNSVVTPKTINYHIVYGNTAGKPLAGHWITPPPPTPTPKLPTATPTKAPPTATPTPPPVSSALYAATGNYLYAYSPLTGAPIWHYLASNTIGNLVVADNTIYTSSNNTLLVFNASTGNLLWSYPASSGLKVGSVANGLVYINVNGDIEAISLSTHTVQWHYETIDNSQFPAITNNTIVVRYQNSKLVGLDSAKGTVLWQDDYSGQFDVTAPVVADGLAFSTRTIIGCQITPCGGLIAFDVKTGYVAWEYTIGGTGNIILPSVVNGVVYFPDAYSLTALDEMTGHQLWYYNLPNAANNITNTPTFINNIIYFLSDDNNLYALNTVNQTVRWTYSLGHAYNAYSFVVNNGLIYANDSAQYLDALNADTGSLVWHTYMANSVNALSVLASHIASSPTTIVARSVPGNSPTSQNLTLSNPGTKPMNWQITSTIPSWLGVSATSGTLAPGASQTLSLMFTINNASQSQSVSTSLVFTDANADNTPLSVPITAVVAPATTLYTGAGNFINAYTPTTGNLIWRYLTGGYVNSVIPANGNVYAGSNDKGLYALSGSTGALLWKQTTVGGVHVFGVDNGSVYAADAGYVYAFNANLGALQWRYQLTSGSGKVPALSGNVVYVADGSLLTALNATTSSQLWQINVGSSNMLSSPFVSDGSVFVTSDIQGCIYAPCTYLQAYEVSSGNSEWSKALNTDPSPPAISNNIIYLPVGGQMIALNDITGQQQWIYTAPNSLTFTTSPAISNGVVYIGESDKSLHAINISSLTDQWSFLTGNQVTTLPIVDNGMLHFGASDLYEYTLDINNATLIWKTFGTGAVEANAEG